MNEQDTPKGNRSLKLCKRVVTTESFIAEAKEIYGDRYDHSKVDYFSNSIGQMDLPTLFYLVKIFA